jgi:hypothetical protein
VNPFLFTGSVLPVVPERNSVPVFASFSVFTVDDSNGLFWDASVVDKFSALASPFTFDGVACALETVVSFWHWVEFETFLANDQTFVTFDAIDARCTRASAHCVAD